MCSFYKVFMNMFAFWLVFPNSASHILWINSSVSFKAWTFSHLLDSQAMWVLVWCLCVKLWGFKRINVDPALDFLSSLVSIISLAISCLEIGLESQQPYINYQGLSSIPDAWFHPAFFVASWIYIITNCAPMALNGLVTPVNVHFPANTCNREERRACW